MFDDLYRRKERKEMEIVLYDVSCMYMFIYRGENEERERGERER